jgi:hypothetical protein
MSDNKSFERRTGSRKIPVEDVATLHRIARYLRESSDAMKDLFDMENTAVEIGAYADHLDLIVQHCGGSPYESEER